MRTSRLLATAVSSAVLLLSAPLPAQAATASLRIADLSVTETQSVVTKTVAVTRSGVTTTKVTVKVKSANGTAVAPADYAAVPLTTLTFLPGQLTKTVTVKIAGDALDEANETFSLVLSSPVGAALAKPKGIVTIVDNDAPPVLSLPAPSLAEGSVGLHDVTLAVGLSAPSGRTVSATWSLLGGTATLGVDLEPGSGTVVFPPGETSRTITVSIDGDTTDEANERFYVQVAPVNATASTYNRVSVLDDDAPMTPTLFALTPTTGSSQQVVLKGVGQSGTQVQLFANGTCTGGTLATVAAEALASGVPLTAAPNAVTTWSARSVNGLQETSPCSGAVAYTHDALAPLAPTGLGFVNGSPKNDNAPAITATTAEGGSQVRVFVDACASAPVVTSTVGQLLTSGTALGTVADDSTTHYWVELEDAAGNRSTCTPLTYVEDSTPPSQLMITFPGGASGVGTMPLVSSPATEAGTFIDIYRPVDNGTQCQPDPILTVTADQLAAGVRVPFDAKTVSGRIFQVRDAAGNVSGPCDLMFGTFYGEQSTESEPNDSRDSASLGATSVGVTHQKGEIEVNPDAPPGMAFPGSDFYYVDVPDRGSVRAETISASGGPTCASNGLDTKIVIWTSSGSIVTQDDDSGSGLCSLALGSMLPGDRYYVEVTASPFASAADLPLSYDLQLTIANPLSAGVTDTEVTNGTSAVNDSTGTAQSLGAFAGGGQAIEVNGRHGYTNDSDFYSFTLAAPTSVTIDLSDGAGSCIGVSGFSIEVSDGVTKVSSTAAGSTCTSLSLGTLAAGTYYVDAYDTFSSSIFGYHFKIH